MCRREWLTESEEETVERGRRLGQRVDGGDIVALIGPLGSGKTVLAGGIMSGAGAEGPFRSPSFTLVWEHCGRFPIHHVDLYRLDEAEAEMDLPWDRILDRDSLAVIEWADRLPSGFLPDDRLLIRLERCGDNRRRIRLEARGGCARIISDEVGGEDCASSRN